MTRRAMIIAAAALLALFIPSASLAGSYGTELPFASGTGARASGMGLAATSLPGTPSSQYFNPALLSAQRYKAFEFYRTTLFDSDSQLHTAAYVHPSLDWGTLGITAMRLDVGGIEERDDMNLLLSSDLENSMTRVLMGYAAELIPGIAAGANLKVDHQTFGGYSGSAIGADVGFLYTRSMRGLWWLDNAYGALVVENLIEPSVKLDRDDVPDPRRLMMGVSVDGNHGDVRFATSLDLVSPKYSPFHARFGQEIVYRDMVAARVGFDASTPTFGVGGMYRNLSLDYAYREEDLGSNHRISLSVNFGSSLEEARLARRQRADAELQERVTERVTAFEESRLASLLDSADSRFEAGDLEEAGRKYGMALMWDADNERASSGVRRCRLEETIRRAESLLETEDYAAALYWYNQATGMAPDDERVVDGAARCEAAIVQVQDQTRLVNSLVSRAVDAYAAGSYREALSGFEKALELDPGNRIASELRQKCESSIVSSVAALRRQARDRERRGDLPGAISTLERARALSPDDVPQSDISTLRAKLAKQELAAKAPPPEPEPEPAPDIDTEALDRKYEAGMKDLERGEFAGAARTLAQVWAIAPAYRGVAEPLVRAYLLQGMDDYGKGRYDEAIDSWQRVLAIEPDNSKARRYLTKAREELSRLSGGSK